MGHAVNRPEPPSSATFVRLVAELQELGFERSPTAPRPDRAVYTATDSSVTFTIAAEPPDPHVNVSGARDGSGWHLYWTAATPDVVALVAVYAVLNDDPAAAVHAARAALSAPPSKPSTTAG
jgi:hypothetical protein